MIDNACPWCTNEESKKSFQSTSIAGRSYTFHICSACKSVFLYPLPDADELREAYQTDYYGESKERKFIRPIESLRKAIAGRRAKKLARLLPQNARILDIGCGNGSFLNHISECGSFELYGTELPGPAALRASANKNIRVITNKLSTEDIGEGFDLITLFHVFEHLEEPLRQLQNISEMMKAGSFLAISMPEANSLQFSLFGKYWFHLDPPRHLCLISRKAFIEKAKSFGLTSVEVKLFSFEQNPYGFIQSFLNIFNPERDLLYEIIKGNMRIRSFKTAFIVSANLLAAMLLFPAALIIEVIDLLSKRTASYYIVFRKQNQ